MGSGPVASPEAVEYMGQIPLGYPLPGVLYDEEDTGLRWTGFKGDRAPFRGMAQSVCDQVAQHLCQPTDIAREGRRLLLHPDL